MHGDHRVAIVTGGTRGLGLAVSRRLAQRGVRVAAAYIRNVEAAEALRSACQGSEDAVSVHQVDLTQPSACTDLVNEVIDRHGQLDYLVNNAGAVTEQRLDDISVEDWQRQVDVNMSASFFLTQAALTPMTARRFGRIVNIGSVSALMGSPVQIAYSAAKAGVIGLTRSTARAVARQGVTVNCVVPGSFETEMADALTLTDRDRVTSMIPLGRWGRPDELAHAVTALLDDDASYITGAVLTVDGGMSMGG